MNTKEINAVINDFWNRGYAFDQCIKDMAFLGSFSGHYGWKNTAFGDCDIWILCDDINNVESWDSIEKMLDSLKSYIKNVFPDLYILYEVAYGPYKPEIPVLDSDVLFLHITVDDIDSYKRHSDFTKLSWSKYLGFFNSRILSELMIFYEPLSLNLQTVRYGLDDSLHTLESKKFEIEKYDFDKNCFVKDSYYLGDFAFSEYMLYISMTNARNFYRAQGISTADSLPNDLFVKDFCHYLNNNTLQDIFRIKKDVEMSGYGCVHVDLLYEKVCSFLKDLCYAWEHLSCV